MKIGERHRITLTLPRGHRVEVVGVLEETSNSLDLKVIDHQHTGSSVTFAKSWVTEYREPTPAIFCCGCIVARMPDV